MMHKPSEDYPGVDLHDLYAPIEDDDDAQTPAPCCPDHAIQASGFDVISGYYWAVQCGCEFTEGRPMYANADAVRFDFPVVSQRRAEQLYPVAGATINAITIWPMYPDWSEAACYTQDKTFLGYIHDDGPGAYHVYTPDDRCTEWPNRLQALSYLAILAQQDQRKDPVHA